MAHLHELEIFRAGQYPQGRFTAGDLQQIAKRYNVAWHEAPCCLGHDGEPSEAQPESAVGWVTRLWVRGDRLLAEIRDVPEWFAAELRAGRYRKRSIALYRNLIGPDGQGGPYLRHVAWVLVPQVKGLADPDLLDLARPIPASVEQFGEASRYVGKSASVCVDILEGATMSEQMVSVQPEAPSEPAPPETVPEPLESPAEGADRARATARAEAMAASLSDFFAEMVRAGRLTPAQAEIETRWASRLLRRADFGPDDEELLAARRREIADRPVLAEVFGEASRTQERRSSTRAESTIRKTVAADFARHQEAYRRLGVRPESLLQLALAEQSK